jgi:hypothetical protein
MRRLLSAALCLLLFTTACSYYNTSSRDRSLRGTVAIPLMSNESSQAGLELEMTELLRDAIEQDGLLDIIPDTFAADFLLESTITQYDESISFSTLAGSAEEYRLTLILRTSFQVQAVGRDDLPESWEKSIRAQATFYVEGSEGGEFLTREDAETQVREQVVEDILNGIFGEW